ncbi:MAG: hypothetical protein ABIJ09_20030 [Pseudomonadota bacterium]
MNWRLVLRAVLHLAPGFYLLLVVSGAISLVGARPSSETPVIAVTPGDQPRDGNLASFRAGARVRASSTAWRSDHYPLYLIDEEQQPSLGEKWMPSPDDNARWVEVLLARPADLRRLELDLASALERPEDGPRAVTVSCQAAGRQVLQQRLAVEDNRVRAPLTCPGTDVVRLTFDGGTVRVYEIRLFDRSSASTQPGVTR